MCSWCWGFTPVWQEVLRKLPDSISVVYLLGGLAPDSDQPMPKDMQQKLQQIWQTIQTRIPGTTFNYAFWEQCQPRRSTYPACRAIIAARKLSTSKEHPMIQAIQEAYYLRAMNPSDDHVLTQLAKELSLDVDKFSADLNSEETQQQLLKEIQLGRRLGAQGFPSLVLGGDHGIQSIAIDYNEANVILDQIDQLHTN